MVLGVPFFEGERVDEWLVEAKVSFLATGKEVKARLSLPAIAVERGGGQESGSLGYHYNVEDDKGEYAAVWSSREREDSQALYFRVRFKQSLASGGEPEPAIGKPAIPGCAESSRITRRGCRQYRKPSKRAFGGSRFTVRRSFRTSEWGSVFSGIRFSETSL